MLEIARMLGKYEWQIMAEMSKEEFLRWQALIEIEYEERRRSERLARSKAQVGRGRRGR